MTGGSFHFDHFTLDPANRTLLRGDLPVEISARYLDALILLVTDAGALVTKDRFFAEVWRAVPVTDEALTQCIKTLRRQLGDDAGKPRFIETVPKHGYRFVAPVRRERTPEDGDDAFVRPPKLAARYSFRNFLMTGGAGTLGAAAAGVLGGLFYGATAASDPVGAGSGGLSVLMVMLWLTIVAALVGGAGVSFGIAAAGFARSPAWRILGGALGGVIVGGSVKLLGLDAFNLLLGRSPGDITGAFEGMLLGGAVGVGGWLSARCGPGVPLSTRVLVGAGAGGLGGLVVFLLGGTLMGGSLNLLAQAFPGSRLRVAPLGALLGEDGFGPITQLATCALEGALFGGCIVAAMCLARRTLDAAGAGAEESGLSSRLS